MEFDYLENSEMFTLFFGQDDGLSLLPGEIKSHENFDNVLVEKFSDFDGGLANAGIDTQLADDDTFFDNEWMTSKIDLSSLAEFDNSLNLVSAEIQSPAIVTALRDSKPSTMAKIDVIDTNAVNIDKSKDNGPISPEQHVPDDDKGIEDHIQDFLNSYLEAAKTSIKDLIPPIPSTEDDVFIVEATTPTKLPLKRKLSDSAPQGPTPKVKTPEQKQRKRVQNRNAATRYRSKKRSEQEVLNSKCTELEHENADLREKIKSKQQEIEYLKNLIIDVFSKKHKAV